MSDTKTARGRLPKFKTPVTKTSTKFLRPEDLLRSSQSIEQINLEETNEQR